MEVLPALRTLSFLGFHSDAKSVQEALKLFITACQLTNHPVTVTTRKSMISISTSPGSIGTEDFSRLFFLLPLGMLHTPMHLCCLTLWTPIAFTSPQ
jgi:hypothetical protein